MDRRTLDRRVDLGSLLFALPVDNARIIDLDTMEVIASKGETDPGTQFCFDFLEPEDPHKEGKEKPTCPVAQIQETGEETRVYHHFANGAVQEVVGTPIRDRTGDVRWVLEVTVPDREAPSLPDASAMGSAKSLNEFLWNLFGSFPDMVFQKNVDGVYQNCNQEFAAYVGRPQEEIIGKTDYELFDRETADFFRQRDRQAMDSRSARNQQEWVRYPDGRTVLLDMLKKPTWSFEGALTGIIGIGRDITEREEAARERDCLGKVLEATPDLVLMLDPEARPIYINPAGLAWLGEESLEGVQSLPLSERHPSWAWRKLQEEGFPAAGRDGVWEGETALLDREGNEIPTSQTLIAHRDPEGGLQRYSAIYRDLTRIKEANRRILQQKDEIDRQRQLATMGEIASVIGHQLAQPITAARNYAYSLDRLTKKTPPPSGKIQDAADRLTRSVDRIAEVTDNVRTYLRKGASEHQWVDVNALVREVAAMLREETRHRVQARTAGEALWAECDLIQLRESVANLARNGLEAMDEGRPAPGTLTLRTAACRAEEEEAVQIVVKDQGPGFPETLIEANHQPFFTTKQKGTGLGLAIAHSVVKRHGGTLELVNRNGRWPGGEARIRLPVRQDHPY